MIEIYIIDYKTGRGALRSGRPPGFTQIWAKTRQIDIIIIIIIIKIRGKIEGIQMRTWHIWGTASCLGFKVPGMGMEWDEAGECSNMKVLVRKLKNGNFDICGNPLKYQKYILDTSFQEQWWQHRKKTAQ